MSFDNLSPYIYGTTCLGNEDIAMHQRLDIAHQAMTEDIWFHVSDQYGSALSVLAEAYKNAPQQIPKMLYKIEAEKTSQMREVIHRNIEPLGVGHMDIGQLCLRDRVAEDFVPGSEGFDEFTRIKEEGLVKRYVMEVFPWTSPVALKALQLGALTHLIDGLIFYFNPLQRFVLNDLWQYIQNHDIPVIAMRSVCGNNVLALRDIPGAAWKDYIQQRATEVATLFEQGDQPLSWVDFSMNYVYSFPQVKASVGATSQKPNLKDFLRVSTGSRDFSTDLKQKLTSLQDRWSDETDIHAEAWSM